MDKLFEPIRIGTMKLKNRIVMPPMGTNFASEDGFVTKRLLNYHVERAKGGVGLIIGEGAYVEPRGKGSIRQLALDHDNKVSGLKGLAASIQASGAKAALQLFHGGRQSHSSIIGTQPVSASEVFCRTTQETPRALTIEEIHNVIEAFAEGARRTKAAGFDAVEIHGAHGYLINQFLSPLTNKRTDKYGGDVKDRTRFLLEILKFARDKVGNNYPILCRINGEDYIEGGLTLEETKEIAQMLQAAGVDALHISGGIYDSPVPVGTAPMALPRGHMVHLAAGIKQVVNVPVIAVGRINDPELAEKILQEGKADLISMGRALLADPELPKKAATGALDDIRRCTACDECIARLFFNEDVACSVNAALGKEEEYKIRKAKVSKRILIVGGGPAGMEAARVSALRGHEVVLYEKNDGLGGQLNLAVVPPQKEEMKSVAPYLEHQIRKLGVKVVLGEEATPLLVKRIKPDAVFIATGSVPTIPEIPGVKRDQVVTAHDLLAGRASVKERVVVIGGGMVGAETAETLAEEGKRVTILEMLGRIGIDMVPMAIQMLYQRLKKLGVTMITNAKVQEITEHGVVYEKDGETRTVETDSVVLAAGSKPNISLIKALEGKVAKIYAIGNAKETGNVLEAIHEASRTAREI
ncbi:MAG: FAD-dependent oxidoreductase [Candidatus Bathyarchaeota archaeon]|nr:FAD-dependent oxidoreductase [Candidatus Bathyarchaeota archaeon]MDH5623024.1 FAD-dependent oxidoreductase [Candidatus Bathyarchaeota archaeon]